MFGVYVDIHSCPNANGGLTNFYTNIMNHRNSDTYTGE